MKLLTFLISALILFLGESAYCEITPGLQIEKTLTAGDPSFPVFDISHDKLRFRYRLVGLDSEWTENVDQMNFILFFTEGNRTQLNRTAFPVSGTTANWTGIPEESSYRTRRETLPIPPNTSYFQVGITSSGSPQGLGIYSIKELNVSVVENGVTSDLLVSGKHTEKPGFLWNRSGTNPTMALRGSDFPAELRIVDTELTAHADWLTLPIYTTGDEITISWQEAYSIGAGGKISINYDRLPPGDYRFEVEAISIMGQPLGSISFVDLHVPRPIWQTWWFWTLTLACLLFITFLMIRSVIRRRVKRAIRHARLIEKERLRIAMDLHDDIGTRLSQISLAGSHARMKANEPGSKESFQEMINLTGELSSSLSETVWMLSPKNNDLESLIVFLSRIASELCRAGEFRCRIDAEPVADGIPITQEFRHHFVLSVKEAFNNALKHSQGSEIRLEIKVINGDLHVIVADNGKGLPKLSPQGGNGLGSLRNRMKDLNGLVSFETPPSGGTRIFMKAALKQSEYH